MNSGWCFRLTLMLLQTYPIDIFVIETSLSIIFMVDPCSIDHCDDDLECKELFKATCNIMRVTFFHYF